MSRYLVQADFAALPTDTFDFLIIGSGVGGLWCAVELAMRVERGEVAGRIAVVTKDRLAEGSTLYAQGGIAAALYPGDSPADHLADTLDAGAGLCDRSAASVLVTEGPRRVRELVARGAQFDRDESGQLLLAREGAHGIKRIVRAQGDATGKEIARTLVEQAGTLPIHVFERCFTLDLLTAGNECLGAVGRDLDSGELRVFRSRATILTTGGLGQLFKVTTNPPVVTGDGMAMAFRAGARLRDMEFVQFHPTALARPRSPKFLITEAARGEGAVLRNAVGERFMLRYHELAELGPRDVVSRAIVAEMRLTRSDHVLLDLTAQTREALQRRFPCIYATCASEGLDLSTQPIPVSPAAHYMMGGVETGLEGHTNLHGLYACGEVACVGVHGANRLASNSLLEGLVFGTRTVTAAARRARKLQNALAPTLPVNPDMSEQSSSVDLHSARELLREVMWERVGIIRAAAGLSEARRALDELFHVVQHSAGETVAGYELVNMLTLGRLVAQSAWLRQESRGAHWREDFPQRDDAHWKHHLILTRSEDEDLAQVSQIQNKS